MSTTTNRHHLSLSSPKLLIDLSKSLYSISLPARCGHVPNPHGQTRKVTDIRPYIGGAVSHYFVVPKNVRPEPIIPGFPSSNHLPLM